MIDEKEILRRRDMREVFTFTIDPADAKDFDDALSFEVMEDGLLRIGVHIADVSHYVKPGTKTDDDAYKRGTSIYLVDRVIPMLPEELCNDLCSLRPGEDKLCMSVIFTMDSDARVLKHKICRTVIRLFGRSRRKYVGWVRGIRRRNFCSVRRRRGRDRPGAAVLILKSLKRG